VAGRPSAAPTRGRPSRRPGRGAGADYEVGARQACRPSRCEREDRTRHRQLVLQPPTRSPRRPAGEAWSGQTPPRRGQPTRPSGRTHLPLTKCQSASVIDFIAEFRHVIPDVAASGGSAKAGSRRLQPAGTSRLSGSSAGGLVFHQVMRHRRVVRGVTTAAVIFAAAAISAAAGEGTFALAAVGTGLLVVALEIRMCWSCVSLTRRWASRFIPDDEYDPSDAANPLTAGEGSDLRRPSRTPSPK
jgi:hypothetical protein